MLFCAVSTREKKHTHAHTLHCCRPCTMDNAPAYGHIPCRQHATLCHARTCSCFPFQPRNHPATQIDTNKTHLVPLALLSPGVGGGATCAHAICAGRLWGVWESVMESAVWYWDAGHGKRREEKICFAVENALWAAHRRQTRNQIKTRPYVVALLILQHI